MDLLESLSLGSLLVHFLKIKCRHECCRTLCFGACYYGVDKNLMDMAKGLQGQLLTPPISRSLLTLYLFRGVLYELGSYYSNYFMTNAVQKTVPGYAK